MTNVTRTIDVLAWKQGKIQDGSHFVWLDSSGTHFSLSFFSPEYMEFIWTGINRAWGQPTQPPPITPDTVGSVLRDVTASASTGDLRLWLQHEGLMRAIEDVLDGDDPDLHRAAFLAAHAIATSGQVQAVHVMLAPGNIRTFARCLAHGDDLRQDQRDVLGPLDSGRYVPVVDWSSPIMPNLIQRLTELTYLKDAIIGRHLDDLGNAHLTGLIATVLRSVLITVTEEGPALARAVDAASPTTRPRLVRMVCELGDKVRYYLMITGDGAGRAVVPTLLAAGLGRLVLEAAAENPLPNTPTADMLDTLPAVAAHALQFMSAAAFQPFRAYLSAPPGLDGLRTFIGHLPHIVSPILTDVAFQAAASILVPPPMLELRAEEPPAQVSPSESSRLRDTFLDAYYTHCAALTVHGLSASPTRAHTTRRTIELYTACIPHHGVRISYLLAGHSLFPRILAAIQARDVPVQLAAIKFFDSVVRSCRPAPDGLHASQSPATGFAIEILAKIRFPRALLAAIRRTMPEAPAPVAIVNSCALHTLTSVASIPVLYDMLMADAADLLDAAGVGDLVERVHLTEAESTVITAPRTTRAAARDLPEELREELTDAVGGMKRGPAPQGVTE